MKAFLFVLTILIVSFGLARYPGEGHSQELQPESQADIIPPTKNEHPKLDSTLNQLITVYERGDETAAGVFVARHRIVKMDERAQVTVFGHPESLDIEALAAGIASVGGQVQTWWGAQVQALVPVKVLGQLADQEVVLYIRHPLRPALDTVTEGEAAINAAAYRAQVGTSGAGVKVAILDRGFQGYTALQTLGELPVDATVRSFRSDGMIDGVTAHGTACAEIVYDLAPEATYYFVTYGTDTEFFNAVDFLMAEGVQVVSHSLSHYNAGPYDGSSNISQWIDLARARGIFWTNSVGDSGQGHWEGIYAGDDLNLHIWDGISATVNQLGFLPANTLVTAYLSWNDWPATLNDYDLLLLAWSPSNNDWITVAWSTGVQNGTQPPTEQIEFITSADTNYGIAVNNYKGSAAPLYLELFIEHQPLQFPVPEGSIPNAGDATGALTVGAVQVANYNASGLESFSGRGPTNAIGGGAPDYNHGSRTKPDISAPDGVTTETYAPFVGTSASTPHAAGAAVLYAAGYLDAYGGLPTPDQIQTYLENCAETILDWGTDMDGIKNNTYGAGGLYMCLAPTAIHMQSFNAHSGELSFVFLLLLLSLAGMDLMISLVIRRDYSRRPICLRRRPKRRSLR